MRQNEIILGECREGIFGSKRHKFRARYDRIAPDVAKLFGYGDVKISEESLRLMTTSHYVCDVCERCGAVVKREPE